MYQVSDLTDFRESDPRFETLAEARKHALNVKPSDDYPIGIWNHGYLEEIVFQGSIWTD